MTLMDEISSCLHAYESMGISRNGHYLCVFVGIDSVITTAKINGLVMYLNFGLLSRSGSNYIHGCQLESTARNRKQQHWNC